MEGQLYGVFYNVISICLQMSILIGRHLLIFIDLSKLSRRNDMLHPLIYLPNLSAAGFHNSPKGSPFKLYPTEFLQFYQPRGLPINVYELYYLSIDRFRGY